MRILVIGSGGREHALAWKIAQSKNVTKIFCAPGNAGIASIAECVDIKADDVPALLDFARKEAVDLTVVGPEVPLAAGIVDDFQSAGLRIFGPDKKAARLEASKVYSKELMAKYKVPTAPFRVFDDPAKARAYVLGLGRPCVIKADGLAQGKGVIVARSPEKAEEAVRVMLEDKAFGTAGARIIVEDCLEGEEASILVITDSHDIVALASSQDHKRAEDNDRGPNTGGMGAYSPAPAVTAEVYDRVLRTIIYRIIKGLVREGVQYRGVLYAGIMLTSEGPQALEFNVRFGDPETQAILPRMESDLVDVLASCADGKLGEYLQKSGGIRWNSSPCVCVVMASGGYPGPYEKGKVIRGLDEAAAVKDVVVFHAGTRMMPSEDEPSKKACVTDGGRVLGVTACAETITGAIERAYQGVSKIKFDGMHFRRDIAKRAVQERRQ